MQKVDARILIAMAFLFVPINLSILSQFKGISLGQVSGLMNLSRQIGDGMASKMTKEVGQATVRAATLRSITGRIQAQVFMLSFNQLMYTIALLVLLGFIPLSIIRFRAKPITVSDAH